MKRIIIITSILLSSFLANAQKKFTPLKEKDEISVLHKWKINDDGKRQLILKFKNKSKSHKNISVIIGFYLNGVMEEQAEVASCSKKGFFNNLFLTKYGITSEYMSNEQLNDSAFNLEIIKIKTEETNKCEKQHQ